MKDKILIESDGSVENTKVKINGVDFTSDYKVYSIYFTADGAYSYKNDYSGNTYVRPARVSYSLDYSDKDGTKKSMAFSTMNEKDSTYNAIAQKDFNSQIGLEDKELKTKLIDNLDTLRDKGIFIPERKVLETRTIESVLDKYNDIVTEIEIKAKADKESKNS